MPNSLDRRPPWYCIVSPLLQTDCLWMSVKCLFTVTFWKKVDFHINTRKFKVFSFMLNLYKKSWRISNKQLHGDSATKQMCAKFSWKVESKGGNFSSELKICSLFYIFLSGCWKCCMSPLTQFNTKDSSWIWKSLNYLLLDFIHKA